MKVTSPFRRDRALEAITELCATQGYHATSVSQISDRAGISPSEFEELFSDKEECMLAAESQLVAEVVDAVLGSFSPDRSELESGLLGMKAILEFMAANPSLAHCGYITCRQMAPRRIRAAQSTGVHLLAAMIERLREYSQCEAPPTAGRGALGGAEAVVRNELVAGRTDQLPRLLPDLAYGATVAFLGQEEALQLSEQAHQLLQGTAWG
jgi:AcrR family transcriptional regulator